MIVLCYPYVYHVTVRSAYVTNTTWNEARRWPRSHAGRRDQGMEMKPTVSDKNTESEQLKADIQVEFENSFHTSR